MRKALPLRLLAAAIARKPRPAKPKHHARSPRKRPPWLAIPLVAIPLAILAILMSGCSAVPPTPQPTHRQASRFNPPLPPAPDAPACLASLSTRGAGFTPLPDTYYGNGCATIDAVKLYALEGDSSPFGITNLTAVSCPLANAFAGWARYGVDRAARQILGSPLVRIETMGSYSCRNVAGTEHLSAHARGNAIDVSGFVLADGRRITVLGDWYSQDPRVYQFLRVIHDSACKRFGTVLGPGYNAAHQNHFHVEVSASAFCR